MGLSSFFRNVASIFRLTDLETMVSTEVFHRRTDVQELLYKIIDLRDKNEKLSHSLDQAVSRIRVLETSNLLPHPPTVRKVNEIITRVAKATDTEIKKLQADDALDQVGINALSEDLRAEEEALTALGKATKADLDIIRSNIKGLRDLEAVTDGILADKTLDLQKQLTNLAEFVYTLAKKVTRKKTIVKDICNEIDKKRSQKSGR